MGIETYKQIENSTAPSLHLVVKSYEYIITNLTAMRDNGINHPKYYIYRVNAINKWLDLYNCLDFARGVEVAQNLGNLYGYCMSTCVKDKTGEHTQELIDLNQTVLDGWLELY